MGFVDLHSHVLFGLDDGARTIEESLALLTGLARMGYEHVCATPHQKAGSFLPSRAAIDAAHAEVRAALGGAVGLGLAAENFWDPVFVERMPQLEFPRYDGGRAFLFEVSTYQMPHALEEQLFRLRVRGLLPVMAHPERYAEVQQDPRRCESLARHAALLIDVAALDGAHGAAACRAARAIVERGWAHGAASDVHRVEDLTAVQRGIAWLEKKRGASAVRALLDEGPRRLLAGRLEEEEA